MIYRVHDVLNYGGFFAGDTVTLTAHAINEPTNEQTFTIDQGALTNVGGDRYKVVAGMALDLQFEGERVAAARVIAARERETLRNAIAAETDPQNLKSQIPNTKELNAPRIFSHYCQQCDLWILGEPREGKCGVEGHLIQ
ncbi:MAG: hypothetical protein ABI874_14075 [Chloroflexota bacterium]